MKNIKYLMVMLISIFFASCMGDRYAETDENAPAPYGNNALTESNVISIAALKDKFATTIETDYRNGKSYKEVTEDIQIKGIVTSSDMQGNFYSELAIQDKTSAILISIGQGGLYGPLPIGTEILINLKGLYVGNYGKQAQIGVPSMNSKGATSIGRISRTIWNQHYKIMSKGNIVEPTEFANGSNPTTWNLTKDCGKLGIIRNVTFKSSRPIVNGTYANSAGGAGSVEWTLAEQDANSVIVYNSNFSDFANAKIPTGKVDITGIIKRFNNKWEIIIRTLDDVKPAEPETKAIYSNAFDKEPTDWTYNHGTLPAEMTHVWKWASAKYGMKATAHIGTNNYEVHGRTISPLIDLTKVANATLTFEHAARFFNDFDKELMVQISTDGKKWKNLIINNKPSGENWNFVPAKVDLTPYCGKKVYISFFYNSTATNASTWEFKNLMVK